MSDTSESKEQPLFDVLDGIEPSDLANHPLFVMDKIKAAAKALRARNHHPRGRAMSADTPVGTPGGGIIPPIDSEWDRWWYENHPLDWWKKERGWSIPHFDRILVENLARRSYEAGKIRNEQLEYIAKRDAHMLAAAGGTAIWTEVEKAKADAYEDAAQRVEKLAEDYTHEHGSYDPSTNAWELHHRHGDRIEAWDDAVEAIRKRKAEKCHVTHASQQSAPSYAPRRLPGPLWEIVMHDQDFQDALLDYHNYGGSSARVAKAAIKAIGEE